MNRTLIVALAVPALTLAAAAQEIPRAASRQGASGIAIENNKAELDTKLKAELDTAMGQMKVVGVAGAAMGPTVKGAPYAGVEVSETNQVLADGTRIHNENRTTVYRDSEGRVRRETPNQVTIMDPVARVSYFLNPKTMTATKSTLAMPVVYRRLLDTLPGQRAEFQVTTDKSGAVSVTVNGQPADPASLKEDHLFVAGQPAERVPSAAGFERLTEEKAHLLDQAVAAGAGGVLRTRVTAPGKNEMLGKQMFEGVNADGTRFTTTLDTGAIGNDRPIQIVSERWYSAELQLLMMTKRSDPRTGEEIFRLTNVSRSEPGADLFQVPASYTLTDRSR